MLRMILPISFLLVTIVSFGQKEAQITDGTKVFLYDDKTWQFADSIPIKLIKPSIISALEIPVGKNDNVIQHYAYSLSYNEDHEQADWVAYFLTKERTIKSYERTDKFLTDPYIKTGSANERDYSGSGFDRGHMAPAADMSWSEKALAESFFYSNMSPQNPGFNRGIWKKLEDQVRRWAVDNEKLYIVTGPVLHEGSQTIGKNKVAVPKYYYKVLLDYDLPEIKGIGFILPNESSQETLDKYAVTIDSVESFTGIDFFPQLPDDQEKIIEGSLILASWFSGTTDNTEKLNQGNKLSTSVQCAGMTKSGTRCKNKTLNQSGYCYLHGSQATGNDVKKEQKSSSSKVSGTTSTGQTIYTGPRGGVYHYSSSGKKVYQRKK